jgi:hypothetical protein
MLTFAKGMAILESVRKNNKDGDEYGRVGVQRVGGWCKPMTSGPEIPSRVAYRSATAEDRPVRPLSRY